MNKPECIIFDCDGVLVDSEVINNRVLLEMASEYGVSMDLTTAVEEFSGIRLKEGIKILQQRANRPFPDNFEQTFRARTYEIFKKEMKAVEGVKTLLDSLTIPFCVASSGPVEKIKLNLTVTGLVGYFENRIFSGYDINSWKPDPGIFLYAAEKMEFAPAVCAVIEDSKAGIIAAKRGGFNTFGYAKPFNAKELEKEGATVFYHMHELPKLLSLD
ncbi:haloacid dehalogenase superfamily, subfamily IA, variant 3 with third motif having DD or ED [Chitinophaga sp. CF118]|uniref:HAD-IA family hydrolase n=1 Tax=Chitinophaga sp. CF118 TaxID=1884367 RepID=UPI0008E96149|nr:HAD-IA family hydrolase [Chitinophaga sp. CF118]SFD76123.1 haloacid dehalogenase superfamily, subfamily IA, variant 3 with third motif having DD or ED [Chitinophaga sp. CF118]